MIEFDARKDIRYTVDSRGIVVSVSVATWDSFSSENAGIGLTPDAVIGRALEEFISGESTRASYRAYHEVLRRGLREEISLTCRCDAPGIARDNRLLIRVASVGDSVGFEYISSILSEREMPPVDVLARPSETAEGLPREKILGVCSYCKKVRYPAGRTDGEWIDTEFYEALGGSVDILQSHTICPNCRIRFVEPMLEALRSPHAPNA